MRFSFPLLVFSLLAAPSTAQTVFSADLDASMPSSLAPGSATLTGVQGFAGLGPAGSQFGGQFLRSATGNTVTLTLLGLPSHSVLHLDFLFAAIDSLDGAGNYPSGDYFKVTLDGATVFRESFANALPSQIQTYVPPAGVQLARHQDLGFGGPGSYYTDSAYWLGGDPIFASLPHSAPTATITFAMEGPGIQPLGDESWAIDNLRVHVSASLLGAAAAYGASCGPSLQAGGIPTIGQTLPLSLTNLPTNTVLAFGGFGISSAQFGAFVLPYPLDSYGMPGCWLVQDMSMATTYPFAISGTTAATGISLPNDPSYVGVQFYGQGWIVAPGANARNLLFSNGLRIRIGT
jgi:hypothetical protein